MIVGFIEQYIDPLGHRGEFEGTVHIHDRARSGLMATLAGCASYFEQRMPWDSRFSRTKIEVTTAQVSNLITLAGSTSPFGYAGVNLPNEARLREEYGSKSLLIGNIVKQRREVTGDAYMREFSPSPEAIARARRHGARAHELFVALHEVVGHASGRVDPGLQGEPEDHVREYYQTLEEARADLVALWHVFDPKLVELGIVSDPEVAEETLWLMLRRVMTLIGQLEVPHADEDHDRAELMIFRWLCDRTDGIRMFTFEGKTEWAVQDVRALHEGVGRLLAEVMRIKATGDYQAARSLVEGYGVRVEPELHRELRGRLTSLGVPEHVAFLNPELTPTYDHDGRILDITIRYPVDYYAEQTALSSIFRSAGAR